MPTDIRGYRIFIATPGGLQAEREAFRRTIDEYNAAEAILNRILFIPVGWEDTLGGVGRPQELINREVVDCDYFLLMLWDRWGTPPDRVGPYTSGTEEEFHLAMRCLGADASQHPMRQVLAFFKAVDPSKLSDPGPELKRVLDFKRELESEKKLLHTTFDELPVFQKHLRVHLARWKREHEAGDLRKAGIPEPSWVFDRSLEVSAPGRSTLASADLDEAERLTSQGRLTEAETIYARAIARGDDAGALSSYGNFLIRVGRLSTAQLMYERVLESTVSDPSWQASAFASLGFIFKTRGDHLQAEEMFQKALGIEKRLGRLEDMADLYANIGIILKRRDMLDEAERMQHQALGLNQQLNRLEGQALAYGNLGVIYRKRGELDRAEDFFLRSLDLGRRSASLNAMARAYGNLGIILRARHDTDGAAKMFDKSLQYNNELSSLVGIATQCGYLGLVAKDRGDLDQAEQMFRRSIELNEKLGSENGLAKQYVNMGWLWVARGDQAQARVFWLKAFELFTRLGLPRKAQEIKENMDRLSRATAAPAYPATSSGQAAV